MEPNTTSRIQATHYERGCIHDDDHISMFKLPEGTRIQTNNQWALTCSLGPTWVWHDKSQDWILFTSSVKWTDVELPFERAYELLQTLKTKRQLEKEKKYG